MDSKVKVSVIIPVYNNEDSIGKCLKSVLRQDGVILEVLVVDDKSKDKSREIIRAFSEKDKRIAAIYLEKNAGPAHARNVALERATGDFIAFCDGDDLVTKGAYKEMAEVACREDADIVTGNYSRQYPDRNNHIEPFSHYQAPNGIERCFESGNTTLWNKLYRKSFIDRIGLRFSENLRFYEDYLFYSTILINNPKAAYTDQSVYVYTEPKQQASSDIYASTVRNANADVAYGLNYAWKEILRNGIQRNRELWRQAFVWNLKWYYECSWKYIQNVEEKRRSYELVKDALIWIQENSDICNWRERENESAFIDIFKVDYLTFSTVSFETYLALSTDCGINVPHAVSEEVLLEYQKYAEAERNRVIAKEIRRALEEIRRDYCEDPTFIKLKVHQYWQMIDEVLNNRWALLGDEKSKRELLEAIKQQLCETAKNNSVYGLESIEISERFSGIFGVDPATFFSMGYDEYVQMRYLKSHYGKGILMQAAEPQSVNINRAFIQESRIGHVGMREIMEAVKGWADYKIKKRFGRGC